MSKPVAGLLVLVVVVVATISVLNLVKVDYVIERPGPVYNTLTTENGEQIITVKGADTYPAKGELSFTTVTISGGPAYPVTAWDYLTARFDNEAQVYPEEERFPPNITAEEVKQQSRQMMLGAQEAAKVVALRAAGHTVAEKAIVGQIMAFSKADQVLKVDDVVRAVDGHPTKTTTDVVKQVEKASADPKVTSVPVTIERDGKREKVLVPLVENEGKRVLGIVLAPVHDFPIDVQIDAGRVGGPSAGLMFSLAVYDVLTKGDLTGGKNWAGTGTIDTAGNVGAIGGIDLKMIGARESGAQYFLAPQDNCGDVLGKVPDGLQVVKVATFDDAKKAVETVAAGGGQDLPTCTESDVPKE